MKHPLINFILLRFRFSELLVIIIPFPSLGRTWVEHFVRGIQMSIFKLPHIFFNLNGYLIAFSNILYTIHTCES